MADILTVKHGCSSSCQTQTFGTSQPLSEDSTTEVLLPGSIGTVCAVADGVFAAKALSPKGEPFYLGMEKLPPTVLSTKHTKEHFDHWDLSEKEEEELESQYELRHAWHYYHDGLTELFKERIKPLVEALDLPNTIQPAVVEWKEKEVHPKKSDLDNIIQSKVTAASAEWRKREKHLKMSNEDIVRLINTLKQRKMLFGQERSRLFLNDEFLDGHDALIVDSVTYIAYASKKPVMGKFTIPHDDWFEEMSCQEIMSLMSSTLMLVGVTDYEETPAYGNRAICRNLVSMIEGTYGGISTQLHAFTAKVFSKFLQPVETAHTPKKTHMIASPTSKMEKILKHALGNDLLMGNKIPKTLPRGQNDGEEQVAVPLEALAALHTPNKS